MKDKVISVLFVLFLFSFSIMGLIIKDKDISSYERRKLNDISILKEDFVSNLDTYLTDQFPFRDNFISLNSTFDRDILGNMDSNDVYIKNGYVIEKNYPLEEKEVNGFINKLNYINDIYLKNNNVFYTIIPDKSYFLDDNKYLKIDYDSLINKLNKEIKISYIPIIDLLNLEDYYKTDIHIKQEEYPKIIEKFSEYLNFLYNKTLYEEIVLDNFYGASYSKVPFYINPDKITILTNNMINNMTAKHLEYKERPIYDLDRKKDVDLYNIFLSGPSSLIEIDNPNIEDGRELIIFRDSFASSFSPLLIEYYKKIILIDLRYIRMDIVEKYVDFKDKDVLFAYSTLLVNDSHLLKVDYNKERSEFNEN